MRPIISQQKGKLVRIMPSGKEIVELDNDTWANLQKRKRELIRMGVDKNRLFMRYMRF